MGKQNIFLDFDGTIINTIDAFCSVYNNLYINHPNFKTAEPDLVNEYNLSDECPLVENVEDIFSNSLFFDMCEFINDNTYEVLKELNQKYKIIITSIGTPSNLAYKAKWLEAKLPFINDYILIKNSDCKMDKSIVNMDGGIIIDDMTSNLITSNAETKILFGDIYPWNNEWKGEHCKNWSEIKERLL